jgi:hypothetical protein
MMISKRLIAIVLLCFVAVCFISVFTETASAQDMEKKGIEGLFAGKGTAADDPRLPNPVQKWAGWGSILVMIIVVKYL